jgi:2-oxoglutarate ferredoxin oxidoreductase subunit alpha
MARGQGDYFQATRGGGHGDYRFIVLAPSSVQETVDLTQLGFHLADKWRIPVMLMGDFLLSHTSEIVDLRPPSFPTLPQKTWAITGAAGRRGINLSPIMAPEKLASNHGAHLAGAVAKHAAIKTEEARAETAWLDDAELVVVAFGFPARFVRYAARLARERGRRIGFVRPITLWPFPSTVVADAVSRARAVAVFELNAGQMIEDVELAVRGRVPVHAIGGISHDHSGFGVGPLLDVEHVLARIEALYEWRAA